MRQLKYVFYFECLLMSITVLLGFLAPEVFLSQLTDVPPTELTLQLVRWYAVPFVPLTLIQLATLRSGDRYALRLVMATYLLTDILQLTVTILFAVELGWKLTHLVSASTAILFIASRAACLQDLERVGVRLRG
ncbi:MAG: hypothetical protein ACI8S6_003016 [Myxococcota bacterium]|jgi:hypothetical protein